MYWLGRYLDPVTLTYILRSSDFDTFCVQLSTAKNEINLFNNHILIVAPVTFAPAGAMTPSAEFLL